MFSIDQGWMHANLNLVFDFLSNAKQLDGQPHIVGILNILMRNMDNAFRVNILDLYEFPQGQGH